VFDPETGKVLSAAWEHDGVDSERVKHAYGLLLADLSFEQIATEIGGGWTGKGIRESLMNAIWLGKRSYCYEAKE
jgi:hypothetical protein